MSRGKLEIRIWPNQNQMRPMTLLVQRGQKDEGRKI